MLNGRFFTTEDYDGDLKPITKFAFETLIGSGLYRRSNILWSGGIIYILWRFNLNLGLPLYIIACKKSRNKRKC